MKLKFQMKLANKTENIQIFVPSKLLMTNLNTLVVENFNSHQQDVGKPTLNPQARMIFQTMDGFYVPKIGICEDCFTDSQIIDCFVLDEDCQLETSYKAEQIEDSELSPYSSSVDIITAGTRKHTLNVNTEFVSSNDQVSQYVGSAGHVKQSDQQSLKIKHEIDESNESINSSKDPSTTNEDKGDSLIAQDGSETAEISMQVDEQSSEIIAIESQPHLSELDIWNSLLETADKMHLKIDSSQVEEDLRDNGDTVSSLESASSDGEKTIELENTPIMNSIDAFNKTAQEIMNKGSPVENSTSASNTSKSSPIIHSLKDSKESIEIHDSQESNNSNWTHHQQSGSRLHQVSQVFNSQPPQTRSQSQLNQMKPPLPTSKKRSFKRLSDIVIVTKEPPTSDAESTTKISKIVENEANNTDSSSSSSDDSDSSSSSSDEENKVQMAGKKRRRRSLLANLSKASNNI